jgi:hypothetical protein
MQIDAQPGRDSNNTSPGEVAERRRFGCEKAFNATSKFERQSGFDTMDGVRSKTVVYTFNMRSAVMAASDGLPGQKPSCELRGRFSRSSRNDDISRLDALHTTA